MRIKIIKRLAVTLHRMIDINLISTIQIFDKILFLFCLDTGITALFSKMTTPSFLL